MRKPRIPLSTKKKKTIEQGDNKQETQVEDEKAFYEDIQHLLLPNNPLFFIYIYHLIKPYLQGVDEGMH